MTNKLTTQIAEYLLEKHNLKEWAFVIDPKLRRVLGQCHYRNKTIRLSEQFIQKNQIKEVEDVILHEIAHALTPGHKHDQVWQAMAQKIGANPKRLNDTATQPEGTHKANCPHCNKVYQFYKRPQPGKMRWCKKCGPGLGRLTIILRNTNKVS